jgi:hypothetical protein
MLPSSLLTETVQFIGNAPKLHEMWETAGGNTEEIIEAARARPDWRLNERFFEPTKLKQDALHELDGSGHEQRFKWFLVGTKIEEARPDGIASPKRRPRFC